MIETKYQMLLPIMNEQLKRLWAASEAKALGHGGIATVSKATGLARNTIAQGLRDLQQPTVSSLKSRIRAPGAGRKKTVTLSPSLKHDLETLMEPATRGDPESCLLWTCKSLRKLADELKLLGHEVSYRLVGEILKERGYSLQANKKTIEGKQHPDRNGQFEYIYEQTKSFQQKGMPVISVDTKKKELVGNFKNAGKEWCPKGKPEQVFVYDFPSDALGKAIPYGVYDLAHNEGWVSVGVSRDTAEFAVESIRRWWQSMGREKYTGAKQLLITADGGGSNSSRAKLWKKELQQFSCETSLSITVCHFPPGTSKWNKIEHRLFSYITKNWRGKPLESYEVIVNLIAATTTKEGLEVRCKMDQKEYEKGKEVSKKEMKAIKLKRHEFHGEWNYSIRPK